MVSLRYIAPAEDVRDLVSVYYYFEIERAEFSDYERAAIAQVRFVFEGDGAVEYNDGRRCDVSNGAILCGPTTSASQFHVNGPFRMLGAGLLPAGWAAATNKHASDYVDRTVPAAEVFGEIINERFTDAKGARSVEEMVSFSNAAFRRLKQNLTPKNFEFTDMMDEWLASEISPPVQGLVERSELSSRQILRLTNKLYGMPPKFLARKYRALRAARALAESDQDELDQLADAFYDQSHMIREIKHFAGTTPKKLRVEEGEVASLIDKRAMLEGQITPLTSKT